MKKTIETITIGLLLSIWTLNAQNAIKIQPTKSFNIKVPEPSDVCFSTDGQSLFMVSDKGYLYETDLQGMILRKADFSGIDCEGVYVLDDQVYVAEEAVRNIKIFDSKNLNQIKSINIPYHGARNKGYESITFNKEKACFIIITEQNPSYLFELDNSLKEANRIDISYMARDISSATYYKNFLWLLSDEDQLIIKVDPHTYKPLKTWKIPVINPEGIAFNDKGEVFIVSDGMQKLFYFDTLESNLLN